MPILKEGLNGYAKDPKVSRCPKLQLRRLIRFGWFQRSSWGFQKMEAIKKGLFKVFLRGPIKQRRCETGFGKYNTLDWGGRGERRGVRLGRQDLLGEAEKCQAWLDSIHMDAVKLVPHSELCSWTAAPAWPSHIIPEAGKLGEM